MPKVVNITNFNCHVYPLTKEGVNITKKSVIIFMLYMLNAGSALEVTLGTLLIPTVKRNADKKKKHILSDPTLTFP